MITLLITGTRKEAKENDGLFLREGQKLVNEIWVTSGHMKATKFTNGQVVASFDIINAGA